MAITKAEALDLAEGERLRFGDNPEVYEVKEVQTRNGQPYLILTREDGTETFAEHFHLEAAVRHTDKPKKGAAPADKLAGGSGDAPVSETSDGLDALIVSQLIDYAISHDIDTGDATRKSD